MITMEGLDHVPFTEINTEYFEDVATSLYQEVTKGAQIPEGCHEVWRAHHWEWNYFNDVLAHELFSD